MKKYICPCGYEYDPAVGDPDNGVAPGTAWEDVPADWVCPVCSLGKEVFEQAYRQVDGLSFGLALEAAKMGKKIARKGWNGKSQYVELGHDFQYDTYDSGGRVAFHDDIGGKALVFVGTRGSQVGWLASQSDMLADDWYIVEG